MFALHYRHFLLFLRVKLRLNGLSVSLEGRLLPADFQSALKELDRMK